MLDIKLTIPDGLNGLDIDVEEILDESAAFILSRVLQRFLAEKDPNNKPWKPSKAGISRRAKGGGGTLFDTGRLFRSIQVHKTKSGQRSISTDVPYAAKHQLGLERMIKRPFLGFNTDDENMVLKLVDLRIKEFLEDANE